MNNAIYYVFLGLSVLFNGIAGVLLKGGSSLISFGEGESITQTVLSMITNIRLISGIFFYGMSFVVSSLAYTKIGLGVGYSIIMAGTLFLVTIGGLVFYGEKLSVAHIFGMFLLLSGIVTIATTMKTE